LTCDTGTITRKWTVTKVLGDGNTASVTASQTIHVRAQHNFSITVPRDATSDCKAATVAQLTTNENGCDLMAVTVNDQIFDAAIGDPFCKKNISYLHCN